MDKTAIILLLALVGIGLILVALLLMVAWVWQNLNSDDSGSYEEADDTMLFHKSGHDSTVPIAMRNEPSLGFDMEETTTASIGPSKRQSGRPIAPPPPSGVRTVAPRVANPYEDDSDAATEVFSREAARRYAAMLADDDEGERTEVFPSYTFDEDTGSLIIEDMTPVSTPLPPFGKSRK